MRRGTLPSHVAKDRRCRHGKTRSHLSRQAYSISPWSGTLNARAHSFSAVTRLRQLNSCRWPPEADSVDQTQPTLFSQQLSHESVRPIEAALIVNTKSRRGAVAFRVAQAELEHRGIKIREALAVQDPTRIGAVVHRIRERFSLVIVGGGDGTIATVATQLANRGATLGVIPLGTGNDFARTVGIPSDVVAACDIIASGRVAQVDLGKVDTNCFVNVACAGFSGWVARRVSRDLKQRLGITAFLLVGLREVMRFRSFQAIIEANGERHVLSTYIVVVGNGRFCAGGRLLAPDASIVDGQLVVIIPTLTGLADRIRFGLALHTGQHLSFPGVHSFQTEAVKVTTTPRETVDLDGEVSGTTPMHAQILPRALRVIVPTNSTL